MRRNETYHYTESGLDNVFLEGGVEYADKGKTVIIHDIDGLQHAIGLWLVREPRRLSPKEFRFLRSELLLSQARLAKILGVKELTVGRWERGESEIPLSSEAIVRAMFLESLGEKGELKGLLEEIADLEDEIAHYRLIARENKGRWVVSEKKLTPEAA
ncbi:MAG TPA: helix-turn-helix domain-containing protein [Xanthobacteraceae bacterium]|nr:helix-turn-helix domain-containing protein [Xanthobacteraceae bacterium]